MLAAGGPPRGAPYVLALSMVKNEQDIIEPFIRHAAGLADFLLLLDNRSVDATRRIALDCARELGNVAVADTPDFGYTQSARMTALLHHAQDAYFADFVLLLDADEFLAVPDRDALHAALAAIPPGGAGLLPWRTHVVRAEDGAAADPPRDMRWRRKAEPTQFYKLALRLDGRPAGDLTVHQGSHSATRSDGTPVPTVTLDGLPLLHFPVRSLAQIRAKGIAGWAAYLARDPRARQHVQAFQWRDAFDDVADGRMETAADLSRVSLGYAVPPGQAPAELIDDPPPVEYQRRHSTGAFADPLALVARSWEASLTAPVALLDGLAPRRDGKAAEGIGGTAFTGDWHWQNLFVDVAPFRFVAELLQPASVLDIGCGVGAYLDLFRRCGATTVLGLDGMSAAASVLRDDEYRVADLALPQDLGRRFDLVLCLEVAEHLDAAAHATLVETIARHAAGMVVFSAADLGQPGHGHISCKPVADWLALWAAHGWSPDYGLSCAMRALSTLSWFRRNLLVLRRGPAEPWQADRLAAIGARPFAWYGQAPGIRHFPMTEPMPDPPAGYRTEAKETT
ncbi:methyltransferase domain-containing protein [Paracraurococcus ruber]|uniref:methyltransferase domain-containing protein n=1 Tax=Paracraurococcus ruber TaxID=77675 RepID=UPI00196119EC|nr:methyltransferase domain-containing protein [Paracraurococcus ruber]